MQFADVACALKTQTAIITAFQIQGTGTRYRFPAGTCLLYTSHRGLLHPASGPGAGEVALGDKAGQRLLLEPAHRAGVKAVFFPPCRQKM